MAVTSASPTITSSLTTRVADVDPTRRRIIFCNVSVTTEVIWIGGSTVDDTNGVQLDPGDSLEIVQAHREDTAPQQEWYAYSNGVSPILAVVSVDN